MRPAGAAAKAMLLQAGAQVWNVDAGECAAKRGQIYHLPTGRTASYGELAERASRLPLPKNPQLKQKRDYTLCGRAVPRFDALPKITGAMTYGIDVRLPAMKYAAIRHAPVFAGEVASFDAQAIQNEQGVARVLQLPGAVAVVADSFWIAKTALTKLPVQFDDGEHANFDSAQMFDEFARDLTDVKPDIDIERGNAAEYMGSDADVFETEYRAPFLAHATMEPMNCTAHFDNGHLHVWTGTQDLLGTRARAAEVAGLDFDTVSAHPVQLGGGFGRRLSDASNYIDDCVRIAMQVPFPVKLVWTREEDMQHDHYRPAELSRFRAVLNSEGKPHVWTNTYTDIGVNRDVDAAALPYQIPHQRIGRVQRTVPVPVGYWRSVEHSYQGFFIETFIDELAHRAGMDPLDYRRRLLDDVPRHRGVLDLAAREIGWGRNPGARRGLGIALKESFDSVVAQAAEVEVTADGNLIVHRIVAAVDPGEVIHPDIALAQIEGGVVFGLTAALFGKITVQRGRAIEANFPDYPMLRLPSAPRIDVHFIESGAKIGGMGEVAVPPVAAAVGNAIFAASGQRLRTLPFNDHDLRPRATS